MLVLSRKFDEGIVIDIGGGEVVRVSVVEIRGDKVRLGIEAPPHVPVHRDEIWQIVLKERESDGTSGI